MNRSMRHLAIAALAGAAIAPASATTLIVEASGFDDSSGQAVAEVFSSRAGFLKQARYTQAQAIVDGQPVRWQFDGLAPSDYAVRVWHDINGNGEPDRRAFGRNEPMVFSNGLRDARPDWSEVTVTLGPDPVTVAVDLRVADE